MTLSAGSRLGPYEIQDAIGAGGMGEVYRARDTRLQRDVAIKVLPESFASDRDRLSRFEREAQVLASLNHPHIAHIYGLEESSGVRALVMEFVDGPTLAERLAAGAVPIDEALSIARQIAEGLDAAHERGIVHRDLKPANIKLTPDGIVKVLDFGIAKALVQTADSTGSPTITTPAMTHAGMILGTAAYMSPEQARGKAVDKRADIWAFGVVLHETLTGRRLFAGDTVSDTIAEVLKREIDLRELPVETPASVRRLLARALERDPKKRLRDIGDAIAELEQSSAEPAPIAVAARAPTQRSLVLAALAALAIIATAGFAAWRMARPEAAQRQVIRVQLDVPRVGARTPVNRLQLAISPNGRYIATLSGARVLLRPLNQMAWVTLDDTQRAAGVFFSADSEWIGYWTNDEIRKIPVSGGPSSLVTDANVASPTGGPTGTSGASWADDGNVYYAHATQGIFAVSAAGGTPRLVVQGAGLSVPHVPRGTRLLFYTRRDEIAVHPLDGGDDVALESGRSPRYLAPGLLVFAREGVLFTAPFDPVSRAIRGSPLAVQQGVLMLGNYSQYDVSDSGTLVFTPGGAYGAARSVLKRVGRSGTADPLNDARRAFSDLRLSPDGTRLAVHLTDQEDDIWIQDLARGSLTRFSFDTREDETPVWSPDGLWIAWSGFVRGGDSRAIFRRRADSSGAEELLWSGPEHAHVTDWTPDGERLVVELAHPQRRGDVQLLNVAGAHELRPFAATSFDETSGRVSPDGKWLVYRSNESGRYEIYLQRFPGSGTKMLVSTDGGVQPIWSRDGRELYFRTPTDVMRVSVTPGDTLALGPPVAMFKDLYERRQADNHTTYDVLRDGMFVFVEGVAGEESTAANPSLVAVFNWSEELKRVTSNRN